MGVADPDAAAGNRGIAAVTRLPQRVADDGDSVAFLRREEAPDGRLHAEHREVAGARQFAGAATRGGAAADYHRDAEIGEHAGKGGTAVAVELELGIGGREEGLAAFFGAMVNRHQLGRAFHGQRFEERRVHEGEDGDIGADPEREGDDGDGGEARVLRSVRRAYRKSIGVL
jgi:hypothetical protein